MTPTETGWGSGGFNLWEGFFNKKQEDLVNWRYIMG